MLVGSTSKGETQSVAFLLFRFTDEGMRSVKRHTERTRRASELVQRAGGTCRFYLTVAGPYHMISVVEGLSDRELAKLVLSLDSLGTVRTEVVKSLAFRADDYAAFLNELP